MVCFADGVLCDVLCSWCGKLLLLMMTTTMMTTTMPTMCYALDVLCWHWQICAQQTIETTAWTPKKKDISASWLVVLAPPMLHTTTFLHFQPQERDNGDQQYESQILDKQTNIRVVTRARPPQGVNPLVVLRCPPKKTRQHAVGRIAKGIWSSPLAFGLVKLKFCWQWHSTWLLRFCNNRKNCELSAVSSMIIVSTLALVLEYAGQRCGFFDAKPRFLHARDPRIAGTPSWEMVPPCAVVLTCFDASLLDKQWQAAASKSSRLWSTISDS